MKNKKVFFAAVLLLAGLAGLNIIAYMQVYKMTHFTSAGARTEQIEKVTFARKIVLLLTGVNIPKPVNSETPERYNMTFETIKYEGYNSIKLEAWHIKNRKSKNYVIIFHGYAGSKAELLPEAREFYDGGYSVFMADFYGSGGSEGNTTSIGYNEAIDVKNTVEYVRQRYKPVKVYIYSISLGSAAALRAFAEYGIKVNAAIMECPFSSLLQTVKNRFDIMKVPPLFLADLLVFYGGLQQNFNAFALNPAEFARKTDIPVLILLGDRDKRVTVREGQMVFNNLKGSKEFKLFKDGGHAKFIDSHKKEGEQAVFDFIKKY